MGTPRVEGEALGAATASGGDELRSGCARERAEEGEGVERESARGFQGVAWSCGRRPGEEEAARQGGAGLLGRARASTQLLPLARGRRQ